MDIIKKQINTLKNINKDNFSSPSTYVYLAEGCMVGGLLGPFAVLIGYLFLCFILYTVHRRNMCLKLQKKKRDEQMNNEPR